MMIRTYIIMSQLPMETTVNPDGSITSEGSETFIGGELVSLVNH